MGVCGLRAIGRSDAHRFTPLNFRGGLLPSPLIMFYSLNVSGTFRLRFSNVSGAETIVGREKRASARRYNVL